MRGFRSRERRKPTVAADMDRPEAYYVRAHELQKPPRSPESVARLNRNVAAAQKADRTLPGGTGRLPEPPRKPTRAERRAAMREKADGHRA